MVVLFAAVMVHLLRTYGHSPGVWVDTLIENLFVEDCLKHSKCTVVGAGATVGIFHSAGYFNWRALLEWFGWQAEGTFHVFLVINALGVVLVALAARRLSGPFAAGIAAILMTMSIGVPTQLDVISDVVPMPFLGAVFLIAALTATSNPSLGMTAMLGLIAAVAGNFYATGLLLGVSALTISLGQAQRRWLHFFIAGLVFGIATFSLSPGTWLVNAQVMRVKRVGNANALADHPVFSIFMVKLAMLAAVFWLLSWVLRSSHRRSLNLLAAIFLPLLVPIVLGSKFGRLDPQPKYVAHVIAAVSVAIAIPLVQIGAWLGEALVALRPTIGRQVQRVATLAAPYAACAFIGSGLATMDEVASNQTILPFKYQDLSAAEQALAAHGWSWEKAARNLKAVDEMVRRSAVRWVPEWPKTGQTDDLERAYLLKVPSPMVPRPLPATVSEVRHSNVETTLVGFTCSWIDWKSFRVCTRTANGGSDTCVDSGLPANPEGHSDYDLELPGMPKLDARSRETQIMTIHLNLTPRASCPEEWIYMPRQPGICLGRIVGVDGSPAQVESEGRWVRLKQSEAGAPTPKEVAIEWELGGPNCTVEYRGYPPFFVEGDPQSAAFLAMTLERQWEFR
jgi:hypothetical protein